MSGKVSAHGLAEAQKHTTLRVSQCEGAGLGMNAAEHHRNLGEDKNDTTR